MWPDYELLDFGDGRKLERFGQLVFDRPAPQASGERELARQVWQEATSRYTGERMTDGRWRKSRASEQVTLAVPLDDKIGFSMKVDTLPTGQVGLFPEQLENWRWIARQVSRAPQPCQVLNLFGYTGGSTLAAASGGAVVTHVDAAKPAVATARANAEASHLGEAPIRWLVEDAVKYCRRELKRGNQYHGVVLDPPTYGHGPSGEDWRLARDLPKLLELIRELTADDRRFVLATCHTPGVGPAELAAYLADGLFGHCGQPPASGMLQLKTKSGRRLEGGVYARWPNVK